MPIDIKAAEHLSRAYLELLKVEGLARVHIQHALVNVRDELAEVTGNDVQDVQESHEEIVASERHATRGERWPWSRL